MGWYDSAIRWAEKNAFLVDLILTVVFGVVVLQVGARWDGAGMGQLSAGTSDARTWASLLLVAPLALRRRMPVLSVVLVYTFALGHMLVGIPVLVPADLAVLVSLYSVTVYGPRWAHNVSLGTGLLGSALLGVFIGVYRDSLTGAITVTTVFVGSLFLATWAFALVRRGRQDTLTALRDHAERLEVERDQQTKIATAAERSRIAREMHDIVAHSLSVMIAQADGGRYAAAADVEAATRTLTTISETGRAALEDMRRLLGVLREDPSERSGYPGGSAQLIPQPAAADIESLVAQVRASGMRVSLVRMGVARTLPPGTGLTLFRICQEALTNILKHAGPDPTVTVVLTWTRTNVRLEVDDDGRGAAAAGDGAGQGLLGMRERAAMFGGAVASGPRPGGGFRVMLDLPLPEPRSA